MKNLKFLMFTLITVFTIGFAFNVNAEDVISITNFEQLKGLETAEEGGNVKLDADIVMTDDVRLKKDFVLDLNGHSIDNSSKMTLILMSNVQIKDSSESKTGKIFDSEEADTGIYYPVQVGSGETAGSLVLESGTIEGRPAIQTVANANIVINGGEIVNKIAENAITKNAITLSSNSKLTMNDGKITSEGYGIAAFEDTVVTINNGVIVSDSMALTGNGSSRGADNSGVAAKFYINGGSLTAEDAPAIYLPQIEGETVIKDGVLKGSESAVEIRAGKLTVNGGTFIANTDHNGVNPNGNGSTTYGVALAVAQHTTKQPIDVTVNEGTFTGFVALKESNPQENSAEDISKVKVSVNGGRFTATSNDVVSSEDLTKFINGGTFNKALNATYIAENYKQVEDNDDYVIKKDFEKVTVEIPSYVYTGKAIMPDIIVKDGINTLKEGTDYTIVNCGKNTNVGTAEVTIEGQGNYIGIKNETFKIKAKDISKMTVIGIVNKTYSGKEQTQNFTINGLTSNDYNATYSKNVNAGTATIVITPKNNNYTGTITKTFTINKANNPMTVKAVNKKLKAKKVKKKKQVVKGAVVVSKAQGKVTYAKVSGKKNFTVNKTNGKVTVKKKTKKGTYKIKVKVNAAGNANYKAVSKTVTLTIIVK